MCHIKFVSTGQAVSEKIFEYMVIYMYLASGQGQTTPLRTFFFLKHKSSVHLHTPASPPSPYLITFYLFSPFKCMGNLCWPYHKTGQVHPKVMICINFVELLSLMLHAKLQNHRPSGSGDEDF